MVAELNADPACTGYIVSCRCRADRREPDLGLIDPAKDADGLHPLNLGRLVLGQPGPLPCTPRASWNCSAGTRCRSRAPT